MADAKAAGGLQFHLSPLLLGSLIAGLASTLAVVVFAVRSERAGPPPPPGAIPLPPPSTVGLTIAVGCAVIAWLAVLIALGRDQIFRRLNAMQAHIEEYGEQRDTDGYLRAVRTAGPVAPSEVRPLHRIQPPTPSTQ